MFWIAGLNLRWRLKLSLRYFCVVVDIMALRTFLTNNSDPHSHSFLSVCKYSIFCRITIYVRLNWHYNRLYSIRTLFLQPWVCLVWVIGTWPLTSPFSITRNISGFNCIREHSEKRESQVTIFSPLVRGCTCPLQYRWPHFMWLFPLTVARCISMFFIKTRRSSPFSLGLSIGRVNQVP